MVQDLPTTDAFETYLTSTTYSMVEFYAVGSAACKQISPIYDFLSNKHTIPGVLEFAKTDVDKVPELAARYGLTATDTPAFVFFKDGRQVAVNGNKANKGADVKALIGAVEKLSGLAKKRVEKSSEAVGGEGEEEGEEMKTSGA